MAKQKAAAKQKNMTVGIIGMGYVGLPLAQAFCNGVKVLGFDINENRRQPQQGPDADKERHQRQGR